MGRRVDWAKIAKMVQKINEHNLSYREGAKRFGIKLRTLYEYNKRIKKEFKSSCSKQEEAAEKEIEASNKEEKILVSIGSLLPEEIKEIILKYRREHPARRFVRH
jgi:transposase